MAVIGWYNSEAPGAIVLAGGYGCGKTSLAKLVLMFSGGPLPKMEWRSGGGEVIYNASFYSEPDLLSKIKTGYSDGAGDAIIKRIKKSELLILDDIGAAYVKDESARWYEDIMWRCFDGRANKKTLITTNLTPLDLQSRVGGRCWSRLKEMMGTPDRWVSMFNVPDYRNRGFEK